MRLIGRGCLLVWAWLKGISALWRRILTQAEIQPGSLEDGDHLFMISFLILFKSELYSGNLSGGVQHPPNGPKTTIDFTDPGGG